MTYQLHNGFIKKLIVLYITYAYVYNAYSDPNENADHQYGRQLQKASMKYVNYFSIMNAGIKSPQFVQSQICPSASKSF